MEELYEKLQTVTVPSSSMAVMAVTGLLSVLIPVALAVYFYKKYKCNLKCLVVGALVWIVFSRVLEGAVHYGVLLSPAGDTIKNTLWMSALYGGLMAGLFEEVGRFVGMKYLLKDCFNNDRNGLKSEFFSHFLCIRNRIRNDFRNRHVKQLFRKHGHQSKSPCGFL